MKMKLVKNTCFPFSIVLLIQYCCFMVCLARSNTNLTTDQSALLAFKAHITSDPGNVLTNNWSSTTSVCNWVGVSCGLRHHRVTALHLPNMGLEGTIAPHLGNLSFLTSLDVRENNFNGYIPQELARLHRLKEIDFEYNNFSGTIPPSLCNISKLEALNIGNYSVYGNIPEEIGNLSKLKVLYLSYNKLTGSIPPSIFNISSLKQIDFTDNMLSGSLPADMCNHLPELEQLYLSLNRLQGQIPSNYLHKCRKLQYVSLSVNDFNGSIPREIGNLTMLKVLYIGVNNWGGTIPSEMGNLPRLEKLSLTSSSLTGPIPLSIFNISSVKVIDFSNNTLSGSLPVNIHYHLPLLEEIELFSNLLTGQIPSNLLESRRLRVLLLYKNKFTGGIPNKIGNLTLLKQLHLGYNHFTGTLPDEIANLNNLEIFSVSLNNLTGLVPFKIFNMSTLKFINLNDNHFSGHLPSTMGLQLPNLQVLYLGRNKLSGTFPSSISNASKLTVIDISNNSFTGSIPNSLGNLRLLQQLFLGGNGMTKQTSIADLFTSLTNCRDLVLLDMGRNPLDDILPISVGNLSTSLRVFSAFECKMKGNIPSEMGNLRNLEIIALQSNELAGPIPTTLRRLQSLERLYLSLNNLQGHIPNELCQLGKLGDLLASDNKLNGLIPTCLGELKSLRRLHLANNKLTSMIPSNIWSLEDLLYLNLSSNSLSGHLPLQIGNLKVITVLDLSWNGLSNDIPNTIGGAQSLVYLSLAHNKLQGPIPQSLDNLINLEFLDLSENNLSGVIPVSLEELRHLQYLNVSFNRLQGEIPTGGSFANFTAQSFMHNNALCGVPRLQVPPCKRTTLQRSKSKIAPLFKYGIPLLIASAIIVVALIFVSIGRRKQKVASTTQIVSPTLAWRWVSYEELLRVTDAFSETNLLGVGSFGAVYKGMLSDGMSIAVKVFNLQIERAFKSFDVECEVIRNIRHRNLIKIISSCTNLDFKALVLEYMPNGSLEKWLYSHNYCLDILQRLNIMIDVASALEYLHHGLTTPIVHCDLKPSNVLLDEDMIAHVADFGIAKLLGEGDLMAQTMTLATIGYMAPEYGTEGRVSTRCDVYSYGIMLMEMFTRKKPTDEMFSGEMSLKNWVNEALNDSIIEVVDTNLIERDDKPLSLKEQCISSIFALALGCSNDSPEERINMEDALVTLKKIKISFLANVGRAEI